MLHIFLTKVDWKHISILSVKETNNTEVSITSSERPLSNNRLIGCEINYFSDQLIIN